MVIKKKKNYAVNGHLGLNCMGPLGHLKGKSPMNLKV